MNKIAGTPLIEAKKDLGNALKGLRETLLTEHNFRLELGMGIFVILLSFLIKLNSTDFCIILIMVSSVLMAEVFNSALERVTSQPKYDPLVGIAKDMAAGAVLIAVVTSVVIGVVIFLPYLNNIFRFPQ